MVIEIDFNSDEAIYVQLCNQIIMGIATSQLQEGENLPSVRQLADTIGINMHTVNKAYTVLRQEGFVNIDRRRGAVIAVDVNKARALQEMKETLAGREEITEFDEELYRKLIKQILVYKDNSVKVIFHNNNSIQIGYGEE